MKEWIVKKILNWDKFEENNTFLNYLNSFDNKEMSFVQIRTGISFKDININQEQKANCLSIIIKEYSKCKCIQDLDALIKELLTKDNRTDMDNYIIFHLENLYNDSLTLNNQDLLEKNSENVNIILTRSLYLASESLPSVE